MKKLALVLLVSFTAIAATADTWMDDRGFTWLYSISGNEATITGISPKEGEMPPIPSELGGRPVTSIGAFAFWFCSGFTGSLTFGNSVTNIGQNAFSGCSGFTGSLTIPDSVTSIGGGAFYGCSGFTGSLTIGDSVTSIGNGAFSGCSGFTGSLTIPDSVTSIGEQAFYGCSGLTGSLTIPDSVASIEREAFSGCSGFTGSLTIPDSVTSIGLAAFWDCSGFTGSLTIGDSVTSIRNQAFSGCSGFTGSLTIPDSVTSIGNGAFSGCSGFTGSLTIPDGVTSIESFAFSGCSGFNGSLTIPDSVTSIGECAFRDCTGLPEVVLPATVESMRDAFLGDVGIKQVTIADGAKVIGGFYGCTGLTEVEIPDSVTNIEANAFRDCTELVNVNMPTSLVSIGEYAFSGCHKLLKLEWLPGVSVGQYAFQNCKSWQGVFNVPAGVTEIAEGVFCGCQGLQHVNLPDGVMALGAGVFSGCQSLVSINLPNNLTRIERNLLAGCSSLISLDIPDSVQYIGDSAFFGCGKLSEVKVPHGVTTLGSNIFPCEAISIRLPSTLSSVSTYLFREVPYASKMCITFDGDLPVGYEQWFAIDSMNVSFSRASGSRGFVTWPVTQFMGYTQENEPVVTIVSSKIRENDPEVLDVVYKVTSTKPTVKVRALAFEDGVRSFANVVRPEDFIADLNGNETSGNVGDAVTANEEHTLSWKVSSDWATRLAKVSFEVLATEDNILPLELMTIPGTASHPETWQVSWNYITADKSFEALLWLYADKDLGLTLQNGVLKNGDTRLCSGASVSAYDALVYIYGKMGFQLLDGDALSYVKEATRFDLPDKSGRQYAYRVVTGE